MSDIIIHDHNDDGVDRRGFLKCMAWAGTGLAWAAGSGILRSEALPRLGQAGSTRLAAGDFVFAQISDSHIGFSKDANKDVVGTLQAAIARIQALPVAPEFLIHTGDLTHLAKPEEFDTLQQVLTSAKVGQVFYVPGEHDVLGDDGKQFLARYGKGTRGSGWFSFDHKGVHFIGLVNVVDLKAGGLGNLGAEQLAWLEQDVRDRSASTPIVVFAHIPLWSVYPEWGWATDDGARAVGLLKKFGSVTVLNGHIHQTLQKIEGNVTFHTAASTAFPQPAPGAAPSPGPLTVPADRLRRVLGLTEVTFIEHSHSLPIVDLSLSGQSASALAPSTASAAAATTGATAVAIDNFKFAPAALEINRGTKVTWTNHDDVPHTVVSTTKVFASSGLDTNDTFSFTFKDAGKYDYFCSMHPRMTGSVAVK